MSAAGIVSTLAGGGFVGTNAQWVDAVGTSAGFANPVGLAIWAPAGVLYVADSVSSRIRIVSIATGVVSTIGGAPLIAGYADGTGTSMTFSAPWGIAVDALGNVIVADRCVCGCGGKE